MRNAMRKPMYKIGQPAGLKKFSNPLAACKHVIFAATSLKVGQIVFIIYVIAEFSQIKIWPGCEGVEVFKISEIYHLGYFQVKYNINNIAEAFL